MPRVAGGAGGKRQSSSAAATNPTSSSSQPSHVVIKNEPVQAPQYGIVQWLPGDDYTPVLVYSGVPQWLPGDDHLPVHGPIHHTKPVFLPFKMALLYARALNLVGKKDWQAWSKSGARPANMPSNPHATYTHDGWQGYGHWLGTGNAASKDKQFLPFKKALLYARSLNLKGAKEWREWRTGARPANIPQAQKVSTRTRVGKGTGTG